MIDRIPDGCDCVWSLAEHDDGAVTGCIFIASENCQRRLMHPRTFRRPAPTPTKVGAGNSGSSMYRSKE